MQRREEPQLHGAGHTLLEGFDAHDLVIGAVYRDAEVQPFGSPVSVVSKPIFAAPAIVSNIDCVISLLVLRNYLWIIPVSGRLHLGGNKFGTVSSNFARRGRCFLKFRQLGR